MPEFLRLEPPQEALSTWISAIPKKDISSEEIKTSDSLGRTISKDIHSNENMPSFTRSTVDGYAVIASDTHGASETLPIYIHVVGEVFMGMEPKFDLKPGEAALIHTGGMLPKSANAVVMVEYTQIPHDDEVEIFKAVALGENLINVGEDIAIGDQVFQAGQIIRPAEIGGLLALGKITVPVVKKPRIGIISSGDEVIDPQLTPKLGQVRDINSYSLSALITQYGGIPERVGIAPDNLEQLETIVQDAYERYDAVIVTAGSSASTRDYTSRVIDKLGYPGVLVHGVNVRPGKPTILAVCDGKPVVGLPGNPISSLVIAWLFVVPMIKFLKGDQRLFYKTTFEADLSINVASSSGREEWIPVKIIENDPVPLAEPIFYKSNLVFSLSKADGLMVIPATANGINAGERIQVYTL
ncbi:MAG: molybdopterin molybdenumtransferase MoeA [Bacteroidales bacterium]|nr:molybdopterin molybdenumtransferase MoeA [Bacteroidales bacterium]